MSMRRRHLLVLDSAPASALVTQRGLELFLPQAVYVTIAASPAAAWAECGYEVDLLIVDPHPHHLATIALLKRLANERPALPVLVLASHDTPLLRTQAQALGVRRYLAKPIALPELAEVISAELQLDLPAGVAAKR